jgi:DNA-binding response OmpR family regulator
MARLALIEPDLAAATALSDALRAAGHDVIMAPDTTTDVVILGQPVPLPPGDWGLIVLIAPGARPPAIAGEWFEKPVRLPQLLETVQRLARQRSRRPRTLGPYRLDPVMRQITAENGAKVRLTDRDVEILDRLAAAGDDGLSRDQLLTEVWGWKPDLETHTVETHLYRLRRKLKPIGADRLLDRSAHRLRLNMTPDCEAS